MKVAVIGAGYVGGVSAACLAGFGHEVAVHDLMDQRARALASGDPPFFEPGLREVIARADGRLRAIPDIKDALHEAEVVLICVDTPQGPSGSIDASRVEAAVRNVALRATTSLTVAIRSTVIPGTTDRLATEVLMPAHVNGVRISVAANPEFLREGRAVNDFTTPDRIVIGTSDEVAKSALEHLYGFASEKLMHMSATSAELSKYANNSFLAVLVSFSNEIAALAERIPNSDVLDVMRALHADRRWRETEGSLQPSLLSYLWPGCGYGGSCLPKDVKAIVAAAQDLGIDLAVIRSADEVNQAQASRLVAQIGKLIQLKGARIAVLGTAFKSGTTDVRNSPGLAVADELRRHGSEVAAYDPLVDGQGDLDSVLASTDTWVVINYVSQLEGLPGRADQAHALLVDARRHFPQGAVKYFGPGQGPHRATFSTDPRTR